MSGRRRRRLLNGLRRRVPFVTLGPLVPPGLEIGKHTYGPVDYDVTFLMPTEGARIVVGAFCSIHGDARILGGGEHIIDRPSTFPLKARLFDRMRRTGQDERDRGPTVIGNDVYIGVGAIVLPGVNIGDGAVIGAGAVVRKDVPAYAIVVGNPAQIVRYRFDSATRERLLALKWWDWDEREIEAALPMFMSDVETFLDAMERARGTA